MNQLHPTYQVRATPAATMEWTVAAPVPAAADNAWTLETLCTWVENTLSDQHAPGRVTGGVWNAQYVRLDFTPQAYTSVAQVRAALPFLAAALGASVTGTSVGAGLRLDIALATAKSARHRVPEVTDLLPQLAVLDLPVAPAAPAVHPVAPAAPAVQPVSPAAPAVQPVVAPLTRPTLLAWLYAAPVTCLDTTVAADLDVGMVLIQVAQILQHPVAWVEPLAQVGRFVRVAYAPIASPDPDMIVALMPGTEAFQTALRRFQAVRLKPHRGNWDKWYRDVMAAARELVAPLQALRPTPEEALFVLRWAALVAAGGYQTSVVDY